MNQLRSDVRRRVVHGLARGKTPKIPERYEKKKNFSGKGLQRDLVAGEPFEEGLMVLVVILPAIEAEFSPGGVEFFGKGDAKDVINMTRGTFSPKCVNACRET